MLVLQTTLLVFKRVCLQCEILLTTKYYPAHHYVLHSPRQWGPQLLPWQAAPWTVELRCTVNSRTKWCASTASLKLKKRGLLSLPSPLILSWPSLPNSPSSTWSQKHKRASKRVLEEGTPLHHCNFTGPCAELEEPSEFNDNYSIAETMKSELSLEQPTSVWSTLASQYWRAETSMMHPHAVKWEINPAVWGGYQDEVALHPPSHTEFISSSSGEGRTRWSSLMGYQKEGTFAHKTALV